MMHFKLKVIILLFSTLIFKDVNAFNYKNEEVLQEKSWQKLASQFKIINNDHAKWVAKILNKIPRLESVLKQNYENNRISQQCKDQMVLYNQGISNAQLWAMTMLDASAKFPESILSGAFTFFGNFDQCLSMKSLTFDAPFSAQSTGVVFVIKSIEPNKTFSLFFVLNVCMPELCNNEDIKDIFQSVLAPPLISIGAVPLITVPQDLIFTGERKPLDTEAISILVLFSLIIFIVLLATLYDIFAKEKLQFKERYSSILLSFSAYRNIKSLMLMKHSTGSISCLHGLRVLTLFWIMLGHRYVVETTGFLINLNTANELHKSTLGAIVYNSYVAVDTFFFLSGFLICFVFIKEMEKEKSFNIFKFYLYRYIRLTTTLAVVIAFYATLFPYIGYGPAWNLVTAGPSNSCRRDWWLSLLYFNNYIHLNPDDPLQNCVDQSWYLNVDMQLVWLSPLVLIPLWKWPQKTYQFLLLLILASCFAPFISTYINEFPMNKNVLVDHELHVRYVTNLYEATQMRATPYLIGIVTSYVMFKVKNKQINIKWWSVLLGWLITTVICLAVVFSVSIMYKPYYIYDKIGAAFYAGFHRLGWSISLAWIVFVCDRGYGGIVNTILSWKGWLLLSRLSYSAYLTHTGLLFYHTGHVRNNGYFSNFGAIHDFFGDILLVILCIASVLYIFCEAPTINLLQLLLKKSQKKS